MTRMMPEPFILPFYKTQGNRENCVSIFERKSVLNQILLPLASGVVN